MTILENTLLAIVKDYSEGNFENARLKGEKVLSKEQNDMFRRTIELALNRSERPCKSKKDQLCSTVQEGCKCRYWTQSAIFKKLFLSVAKDERTKMHQTLVALYFAVHASAYERWEDSFAYDDIGCRLHLARQLAACSKEFFGDDDKPLLESLEAFSLCVHHDALRENAMVANNSTSLLHHAKACVNQDELIISMLTHLNEGDASKWVKRFGLAFKEYIESFIDVHRVVVNVGELAFLQQNDHLEYRRTAGASIAHLKKDLGAIEESGDMESASEIRAHIRFFERHLENVDKKRLSLESVGAEFYYGFFVDLSLVPLGGKDCSTNPPDFVIVKKIGEHIRKKIRVNKSIFSNSLPNVDVVSDDPAPDILETAIGEEHFANFLVSFEDVQVWEMPEKEGDFGKLLYTLTPKLLQYSLGVGCLKFELSTLDWLTVPHFWALKNFPSPSSAQYEIKCAEGTKVWPRLTDLANDFVKAYYERLFEISGDLKFREEGESYRSTESWFSNFNIYKISEAEGQALELPELEKCWEWPGIVSYQRADKATVDDWISVDPDAMGLHNLAGIRAHKGDVFFLSENHSIIYLPDDPYFIVLQYMETAKWVFLIRTMILFCLQESDVVMKNISKTVNAVDEKFKQMHEEDEKIREEDLALLETEVHDKRMDLQRFTIVAMKAIDHTSSAGVSQYADHGLLLKRSFEITHVTHLIDTLIRKVDNFSKAEEFIDTVVQRIIQERERKAEAVVNKLLFIIAIVSVIGSVHNIYSVVVLDYQPDYSYWFFVMLGASLIAIWLAYMYMANNVGNTLGFCRVKNITKLLPKDSDSKRGKRRL